MIGLDTNALVRYLTQDDKKQTATINQIFAEAARDGVALHVDIVVLCELVWVLRGAYKIGKHAIVDALERIVATRQFSVAHIDQVQRAIGDYRAGKGDFADYLIGVRNQDAGCDVTVTFDRAIQAHPRFASAARRPAAA